MNLRPNRIRLAISNVSVAIALVMTASCGGEDASAPTGPIGSTPTPAPPSSPYTATPVPFGLTQDRTFGIFGWDDWPANPIPSVMQLRWVASPSEYEVLATGMPDWGRLRLRANQQPTYDVFKQDGSLYPFTVVLLAPTAAQTLFGYMGDARIFESGGAKSYVAFGLATDAADVPSVGIKTCNFDMDEIGGGQVVFDFSAGTATGSVKWFYGTTIHQWTQVNFTPSGAIAVSATYGGSANNVIEGRFFGPQAAEIAIRAKGEVSGIMLGKCVA